MKKLIVVADDYGLTKSVNKGIIRAYNEGIVTEISLMLKSPGSADGIKRLKAQKIKDVGIHLLFKHWKENGKMFRRDDYIKLFKDKSTRTIKQLALAEFEEFEKRMGFKPTHICPQYGIHGNLKLINIIIEYAKKLNIPVRIPIAVLDNEYGNENYAAEIMLKRAQVKKTDHLFGHVLGADLVLMKKQFLKELKAVGNKESTEIYTHPGYFDKELLKYTSLTYERARDLALSLDKEFQVVIEQMNFTLSNYSQL